MSDRIRSMPDFIVQDDRNHRLYFVEVKYRSNGKFSAAELSDDYPWPDTVFIVMCREHIKCLTYQQLAGGLSIGPACNNLLISAWTWGWIEGDVEIPRVGKAVLRGV
ncbi:MAG: hypothetical protein IPG10_14950 [Flavobacteriales bacterium]|nr:hypothetical protein [Flavobacteriales bacterium]